MEIDLHPDNKEPRGLTGAGNMLWAADQEDEKAYAYRIPNRSPSALAPVQVNLTFANQDGEEVAAVTGTDPDVDTLRFVIQDETDQPYRINAETGVITTYWPDSKPAPATASS